MHLVKFVATAPEPLYPRVRRQACNSPPEYFADALEWTEPLVSVFHLEKALSRPVERDGVNIDLASAAVGHLEAQRRAPAHQEVAASQSCRLHPGHVAQRHYHVEIAMRPRLTTQQSIDAPPAVKPDLDTEPFQERDDLDYIFSVHVRQGSHGWGRVVGRDLGVRLAARLG
jgi:hypothetical protein